MIEGPSQPPHAAVFLDKDGTIIEDVPYSVDPDRMRLTIGAAEGMSLLHEAGYQLVVVSNQSGVARGYFPEAALEVVRLRLEAMLGDLGVPLCGFYCCPHHPEGVVPGYATSCECRKPKAGLVWAACRDLKIDPVKSWLIGDKLDDVEAGRRAGCRTILITSEHPDAIEPAASPLSSSWRRPHFQAPDLAQAARLLLGSCQEP
jgi:D-glycero-D-manno-heptose 1,7-bisphosphate phosphatase